MKEKYHESKSTGSLKVNIRGSSPEWRVAAIIPFCNRLAQLRDAVESAIEQTYPTSEIIIGLNSGNNCVRKASTVSDYLADELNLSFDEKSKIRVLEVGGCEEGHEEKCGGPISRARNVAIRNASPLTTHFAMLDDDDIWLPHKNQMQLDEMEKRGFVISASDALYSPLRNARCLDPNKRAGISQMDFSDKEKFQLWIGGKHRGLIFHILRLDPEKDNLPVIINKEQLAKHNIFINSSVMIAKGAIQLFDESRRYHRTEDYELWKRILDSPEASSGARFFSEGLVFYDDTKPYQCA